MNNKLLVAIFATAILGQELFALKPGEAKGLWRQGGGLADKPQRKAPEKRFGGVADEVVGVREDAKRVVKAQHGPLPAGEQILVRQTAKAMLRGDITREGQEKVSTSDVPVSRPQARRSDELVRRPEWLPGVGTISYAPRTSDYMTRGQFIRQFGRSPSQLALGDDED